MKAVEDPEFLPADGSGVRRSGRRQAHQVVPLLRALLPLRQRGNSDGPGRHGKALGELPAHVFPGLVGQLGPSPAVFRGHRQEQSPLVFRRDDLVAGGGTRREVRARLSGERQPLIEV